jgi:hypothetical protein
LLDPPVRIRVPTALILVALITAILGARRAEHAGVPRLPSNILGEGPPPTAPVEPSLVGELVVKAEWFDLLFGNRGRPDQPQPRCYGGITELIDRTHVKGGTFRTLCVRLCFPVSFRTPRAKLGRDAKRCEHSCPSEARLFVIAIPIRPWTTWLTLSVTLSQPPHRISLPLPIYRTLHLPRELSGAVRPPRLVAHQRYYLLAQAPTPPRL